jgi:glycerophosphoryl diester phosphodiesterase
MKRSISSFLYGALLLLPGTAHVTYSPSVSLPTLEKRFIHNIAHRGAPTVAPENTLTSFRKAVEFGATMIELDVHQTRDSHLVVLHDETVNRTTNGRGKVGNLTADEIRSLDAGSWFSPDFTGEKIPFLAEVFDAMPDSVMLLIEIKYGSRVYPGIEQRVVDLVRARSATHRVILKSFEDYVVEQYRAIAPEIPRLKIFVWQIPYIGVRIERGVGFGSVLTTPAEYLQVYRMGLGESFIRRAHERGFKVFVWGVHTEERMRTFIEMGVDGIETDYPDVLARLLRERQ